MDFETSEFERRRLGGFLLKACRPALRPSGNRLWVRVSRGCSRVSPTRVGVSILRRRLLNRAVQTAGAGPGVVDLRVANILEFDVQAEGAYDLIVLSETIYSLGWLYPLFDVAWCAAQLFAATAAGGRLLLANTYGENEKDWLMQPSLIETYRDLFRNVGYRVEKEEIFHAVKDGVDFRVLVSISTKDVS